MKIAILLISALLLLTSISQVYSYTENYSEVKLTDNKLDFIFVLHANQALVPYGDVANDLNYFKVLQTLRNHSSVPITLQISGTLISVLQFFAPETIQLIQDGVDDGQFELLGSAYGQNVMYSQYTPNSANTDAGDFDNALQIKVHKNLLNSTFGVTPKSFWNPERVWDPDLILPLLKNSSYQSVFIEDQIIQQVTSTDEYLVRTTGDSSNPLYVINDDRDLIYNETSQQIGLVDDIARGPQSGEDNRVFAQDRINRLMTYLDKVYQSDVNDEKVVAYAQDMEAWGLWQEEGRNDAVGSWSDSIDNVVERLDILLTEFEAQSTWLNLVHPSTAINNLITQNYQFEHINRIPFGEAMWMTHGAQSSGYASWKSWNDNDINLRNYRSAFNQARNKMKQAEGLVTGTDDVLANKILQYMEFIYTANQFEFGCWGCNFAWWERTQTVGIGLEAIKWSLNPPNQSETVKLDLDGDGFTEIILRNNYSMYVFSAEGGRLIAWFDRNIQDIVIYNDAPASYLESGTANFQKYQRDKTSFWGRSNKVFALRSKGLNDYPINNITDAFPQASYFQRTDENSVKFTVTKSQVTVRKNLTLEDDSGKLFVNYDVSNGRSSEISFAVSMFYNLGNLDLLIDGGKDIDYLKHGNLTLGIENTKTGKIAGINAIADIRSTSIRPMGMFAYGIQYNFDPIAGSASKQYNFQLVADFNTTELGKDSTPPVITILNPKDGDTVKGIIDFDVAVTDDFGIEKIQLVFQDKVVDERKTDGVLQFYNKELYTGTYTWVIRAIDINGNIAEKGITLQYTGKSKPVETSNNPSNTSIPTSTSNNTSIDRSTNKETPLQFQFVVVSFIMLLFIRKSYNHIIKSNSIL